MCFVQLFEATFWSSLQSYLLRRAGVHVDVGVRARSPQQMKQRLVLKSDFQFPAEKINIWISIRPFFLFLFFVFLFEQISCRVKVQTFKTVTLCPFPF